MFQEARFFFAGEGIELFETEYGKLYKPIVKRAGVKI